MRALQGIRLPWLMAGGLALGLAAGLLVSLAISPVTYRETSPVSLKDGFKDAYRLVIAAAYAAEGDLARARARLDLLGDADPRGALSAQAQRLVASGYGAAARQLALLANALGQAPPGGASAP